MTRQSGSARRLLRRPGAGLLAVLLLLAGLGVVADLTAPPPTTTTGASPGSSGLATVPVVRAQGVCPDPTVDPTTASQVGLAAPGARTEGTTGSTGPDAAPDTLASGVTLTRLAGRVPTAAAPLSAPGAQAVPVATGGGPLVARATGASAPGLGVDMLTRSTDAEVRGLSGTSCVAPGTDFWFVGSGAVIGERGRVYLSNPEAAAAVVDISLWGPDGPIDAPAGKGIAVAAGAQEVRLLDALAPGVTRFAVHVRTRSGRVSAAVRDQRLDGLTPRGIDWLPVAAPPALHQVVPGVVGGAGQRLLQVAAPGAADAIVTLRLVTASKTYTPVGLDVLSVRAGTVAEVDLSEVAAGEPVAVELQADAPVTAGLMSRVTAADGLVSDAAFTAAAAPLLSATPGLVALVRQGEGATSALLLSAPQGRASVRLEPVAPATPAGSAPPVVEVPAGTTVVVDLATVSLAPTFALAVSPAPGSGPVFAVRSVQEPEAGGPMLSTEVLTPGLFRVMVPRVVSEVTTGLSAP